MNVIIIKLMYIIKIQKSISSKHSIYSSISFIIAFVMLATMLISSPSTFSIDNKAQAAQTNLISVQNWWPVSESSISGQQPFKGLLNGWHVEDYAMYWSVDDGHQTLMPSNYTEYPHKETNVDVTNWNWKLNGRYRIAYIAKSVSGAEISRTSFVINIPKLSTPVLATETVTTPTPTVTTIPPTSADLTKNEKLYVLPDNNASKLAAQWRSTRPQDAAQMDKIANKSNAVWFGGWNTDVQTDVNQLITAATSQSSIPVLVAYNIPGRDCGGYSGGGTSVNDYLSWISRISAGIADRKAIIILEPDSVANIDCMSETDQKIRLNLLAQAVNILKTNPSTYVYIDAGNPRWISSEILAKRLVEANVERADGFALNVSNFISTAENEKYGELISTKLQGKHFVIDTSRNGLGPTADSQWCNPDGRALGNAPTTDTPNVLVDAYLWIKAPGESDGNCNGGPNAGVWWPEYALKLAQNTTN